MQSTELTDLRIGPYLATIRRRLVEGFHPERIIVFGSVGRGQSTPESDIDLLVIMEDGVDRRATAVAMRKTLADIPLAKDILVTTPEHVHRFGTVVGTVLQEALAEGVTIYARP